MREETVDVVAALYSILRETARPQVAVWLGCRHGRPLPEDARVPPTTLAHSEVAGALGVAAMRRVARRARYPTALKARA